jgi:hypothetical protein
VKLGLHYWNFSTPADPASIAPTLAETARIVEQSGVSSQAVQGVGLGLGLDALGDGAEAGRLGQVDDRGGHPELVEGGTVLGEPAAARRQYQPATRHATGSGSHSSGSPTARGR